MIEGRELKYMTVAIFTTEEYDKTNGSAAHDIVIIDDGKESIVIYNRYGSFDMEKRKELHGICVWCNENPCAYSNGCGCGTCPGTPYDCICDAGDNPHDIKCPRNPKGPKPTWDHQREVWVGSGTI